MKNRIIEKLDQLLYDLNGNGELSDVVEAVIECVALIAHELPDAPPTAPDDDKMARNESTSEDMMALYVESRSDISAAPVAKKPMSYQEIMAKMSMVSLLERLDELEEWKQDMEADAEQQFNFKLWGAS